MKKMSLDGKSATSLSEFRTQSFSYLVCWKVLNEHNHEEFFQGKEKWIVA